MAIVVVITVIIDYILVIIVVIITILITYAHHVVIVIILSSEPCVFSTIFFFSLRDLGKLWGVIVILKRGSRLERSGIVNTALIARDKLIVWWEW